MLLKRYLVDLLHGRFGTLENDILSHNAGPPKDQICQVSLKWYQFFNSSEKSPHQLLHAYDMTQTWYGFKQTFIAETLLSLGNILHFLGF